MKHHGCLRAGTFRKSPFFPLRRNRRVSFRVNASLRSASLAKSAIDLGDRRPVPVLEKLGPAL